MASRPELNLCFALVLLACPLRALGDKLHITSIPPGAAVELDGVSTGNTPATLRLAAGSHSVLLKFPGHADWLRSLEILKSSKTSLKATLDSVL
jgi:hypothetical protein